PQTSPLCPYATLFRSWVEALREHGYDVPFEDVLPLIGMGGDQLLPRVTNGVQKHSPEGMKIADRKKQIFKEKYWPRLRPFPCVRDRKSTRLNSSHVKT